MRYTSTSKAASYDNCRREFQHKYIDKVEVAVSGWARPRGTAAHKVAEEWLKYLALGGTKPDLPEIFKNTFLDLVKQYPVSYASGWDEDTAVEAGMLLAERFPEHWESTGLHPVKDPDGKALVENKIRTQISDDLVLTVIVDAICSDDEGNLWVVEFKTPTSATDPDYLPIAPQLQDQQICVDDLCERLDYAAPVKLAQVDMVFRKPPKASGAGPETRLVGSIPAHDQPVLDERIEHHVQQQREIDRGWFPKQVRMAYNTPCFLCDFFRLCHGDPEDGNTLSHEDLLAAGDEIT